jgi:hypothetical protein
LTATMRERYDWRAVAPSYDQVFRAMVAVQ